MTGEMQDAPERRRPRGGSGGRDCMVDSPARWRTIVEQNAKNAPVFQSLLTQMDDDQIHSPRDLMKSLAKLCPDSTSFRSMADRFLESLDGSEKFPFAKAALFQDISIHGKSMDAATLASRLAAASSLGLNSEQMESMHSLADRVASENGHGRVDADLRLIDNNGNFVVCAVSDPAPLVQPAAPPDLVQVQITSFETPNRDPVAFQTPLQSDSPGGTPLSNEGDLSRFVNTREIQSRAGSPADNGLTVLERAVLMQERKEDALRSGVDNEGIRNRETQKQTNLSGSPESFGPADAVQQNPFDRLKSFFGVVLGGTQENRSDDENQGRPHPPPKGPFSGSSLSMGASANPRKQEEIKKQKTQQAFASLQPPEPLTFRLRGGRFISTPPLFQSRESDAQKNVRLTEKLPYEKQGPSKHLAPAVLRHKKKDPTGQMRPKVPGLQKQKKTDLKQGTVSTLPLSAKETRPLRKKSQAALHPAGGTAEKKRDGQVPKNKSLRADPATKKLNSQFSSKNEQLVSKGAGKHPRTPAAGMNEESKPRKGKRADFRRTALKKAGRKTAELAGRAVNRRKRKRITFELILEGKKPRKRLPRK